MEEPEFRSVEVNGVKLEVDMRTARKVEQYRVGDRVKVLVKESYGAKYTPHPGVIVGFDAFEKLPTITVAYLSVDYSKAEIKFAYLNAQSEDVEITSDFADILVDKGRVSDLIEKAIESKRAEIDDLERKRAYFEAHFARYFADAADLAERVDA